MDLLLLAAATALATATLAAAVWVNLQRRRAPVLPPAPSPNTGARVAVLLPVRDEEADVGPCLDTLLAQTAAPAVLVVDDGSTDSTLRRVALRAHREGGAPRLVLIPTGQLPEGWRGKVYALEVGFRHARPADDDWVLTTDADTRHHPDLLARALAAAAERDLDCVSIAGFQEARGPGENLVTPAAFALLDAVLGDWRRAAGPPAAQKPAAAPASGPAPPSAAAGARRRPVANGQFMLLRGRALQAVGGFAAVRAAAMDDVALAAALAAAGFRCGFFRALDLLRVRMYRGLGDTLHGWRRILGALFGRRWKFTPAAIVVLLAPPAALLAALTVGRWLEAAVLWLGGAAASALLRRGSGHHPAWGLLYPLDAAALAALLALALRDWRRGWLASWKGRPMRVAR